MLKVIKILKIDSFFITCEFNNGIVRTIDLGPVIKNHSNLEGIEKLKNPETFSKASIGSFGEIVWDKIITTTYNGQKSVWDYDLSPEFIFENAI
ncbi:MAG: hypothetical protein ACKVOM_09280 [Ferruginibacter sp.]